MNRTIKFSVKNITLYILGFFILGLGVVLMFRGNLGAGPWDTPTGNGEAFFNSVNIPVTKGMVSFVIAFTIMTIIILYTKKWVLIGMAVPSLIISSFIDFWDILVFQDWEPTHIVLRILVSLSGGILIPLGLSFIISSHFPAGIFDELTIFVMDVTKIKSMAKVRIIIEIAGVVLGLIFGLLAGIGLGDIGIATVIVVIALPPLLEFFVKKLGAFDE